LKTRGELVGLTGGQPGGPAFLMIGLATEGGLQLQTGKYQEAEKTLRRALQIGRENPQDPKCQGLGLALALHNLGWCLIFTQQRTEAEADLREALAIEEKIEGPDHPNLARTLTDLAQVLSDEDRMEEAERLLDRALRLCKPGSGPMSPETQNTLSAVGRNLFRLERFTEALPIQRSLVENSRTNYGRDSYSYACALSDLGKTEVKLEHLDEAKQTLEEAVAIGEKLTQGSIIVAEWQTELARYYASQHKLAEAEPLFRKSVMNLWQAAKDLGKDPVNLELYLGYYSDHLQEMGLTREQITERIDRLHQGKSVPDL
jgi:tetratricopeptide (TPR) repeat protein